MRGERILIISLGHPEFSKGGSEIAAYNFYKEMSKRGIDTYFLAAHRFPNIPRGDTRSSFLSEKEILFYTQMENFFLFNAGDLFGIWNPFKKLLHHIKPTIVQFHHYLHLGIEMIREVKNYAIDKDTEVKIFLTLHEFNLICANNGQMVKTDSKELCPNYNPISCSVCFPEKTPNEFLLRELFLKSMIQLVDGFVSPSQFLQNRYIEWGIDKDTISMIDNGQEPVKKLLPRKLVDNEKRRVFTYLGQINLFKGLDVLIDALNYLDKKTLKEIRIHVYGGGLETQTLEYQEKVKKLIHKHRKTVTLFGRYLTEDLPEILQETDWVVMPSIWWENSPLVIQESLKYGRPLLVSNIGGMAEKVTHEKNGLHFPRNNPSALARTMKRAMTDADLYDTLYQNIEPPVSVQETTTQYLRLYGINE